ncbi:MAG: hypothetical protein AB8B87_22605 [Granulosicoccus sp.]
MASTLTGKPNVVVAGYGSWAKSAINPAAEVVAALKKQNPEHYLLHCLDVPVDSAGLYERLEKALEDYQPDIWIGVGVAVGSPAIRLEAIGINIRCFDVPDISGEKLTPTSVIEGAPLAYRSNLMHEDVVKHLHDAGIPAVLSFHAGTHLCNQMLYSVLHLSSAKALKLLSGFVHVPQSTANLARSGEGMCSSMSLSMMAQAVGITIDNAVQQFSDAPC